MRILLLSSDIELINQLEAASPLDSQLSISTSSANLADELNYSQYDLVFCDHANSALSFSNLLKLVGTHENRRIVVLVEELEQHQVLDMLIAGVAGVIAKSRSSIEWHKVFKIVLAQGIYISPDLLSGDKNSARVTRRPARQRLGKLSHEAGLLAELTRRQNQIVALLLQGNSNRDIGSHLDICEGTVKVHMRAIFKKLNVANRFQLYHKVVGRETIKTVGLLGGSTLVAMSNPMSCVASC